MRKYKLYSSTMYSNVFGRYMEYHKNTFVLFRSIYYIEQFKYNSLYCILIYYTLYLPILYPSLY